MATQQLIPALRGLPLSLLKKKYDAMTPEERVAAGFVRPATQAEFDQAQQPAGAPADFGGQVFENPDNLQVSDDTDSGIPALRLPNGVSAETGAYNGQPQMDTSNPAPAQVLPPAMQTIGATFSPDQPYEKEAAQFDPNATYEADSHNETESKPERTAMDSVSDFASEAWKQLNPISAIEGAAKLTAHPIDTLSADADTRKKIYNDAKQRYEKGDYAGAAAQLLYGSVPLLGPTLSEAGEHFEKGEIAKGAGESTGLGLALTLPEKVIKGAPAAVESVKSVASKTSAKAAVTKASEAIRAIDPDVVGIVSPRAAHSLKVAQRAAKVAQKYTAEGVEAAKPASAVAEAPAKTTTAIERDATLDRRNIPEYAGEEETAPTNAAKTRATAEPEPVKPAKVEQMLNKSLGNEPIKPGVPLKDQAKAAAKPSAVPEGFTPVKSSAIGGYKYDPVAREFEYITKNKDGSLGSHYVRGDVDPEAVTRFEANSSAGKGLNALRNDPQGGVGQFQVINGKRVPVIKSRSLASATPESVPPGEAPPKKPAGKVTAQDDLTDVLQRSLDQAKGKKGGVMTTAEPGMLAERWGTSEQAIADTDAQLRGKNAQESQAYIDKLAEAYKKGQPVEPVLETRDANNNIIEVDGRHRALAAKKAGVTRIPVIVRRIGVSALK